MFNLDRHKESFLREYRNKLSDLLKEQIKSYTETNIPLRNILLPLDDEDSVIKKLLTASPEELKQKNDLLIQEINHLPDENKVSLKFLEKMFDYAGLISKNREFAYWLAEKIGRNTCTYCNRQYAMTVKRRRGKNKFIVRPEFDHWFPKKYYPLLSLSLYNLIPSCHVCNSSVKGQLMTDLDRYVHPYVKESIENDFKFKVIPSLSRKSKWQIKIKRKKNSKIDNTIKDMALEEIYARHIDLEVKDLMDFYEAYPEGYLNSLIDEMLSKSRISMNRQDAYRMLFGVEYESDRFLDRPFSKLKRDILEQIGLKDLT